MKKNIDKQTLEKLYNNENMTIADIAQHFDVSNNTVQNRIREFKIKQRRRLWHLDDLQGKEFGCLKVIGYSGETDKRGSRLWECICSCGYKHSYPTNRLVGISPRKSCIKCKQKNPENKKYEEISYRFWGVLLDRSERRGIEISLSIEEAWDLFIKQDRKCALSGIELKFGLQNQQTASLDRKDSSRGYVINNVQWVHKHINYMKWKLSEKEFIELCGKVWNHASAIYQ